LVGSHTPQALAAERFLDCSIVQLIKTVITRTDADDGAALPLRAPAGNQQHGVRINLAFKKTPEQRRGL
jgi:hypothetical protein